MWIPLLLFFHLYRVTPTIHKKLPFTLSSAYETFYYYYFFTLHQPPKHMQSTLSTRLFNPLISFIYGVTLTPLFMQTNRSLGKSKQDGDTLSLMLIALHQLFLDSIKRRKKKINHYDTAIAMTTLN